MDILFENPLPILAVGGLLILLAGMVFFGRRTAGSLAALALAIAATLGLLLVERMILTDREQIETGVYAVMDAIEQNNVAGVVEWIDPVAGALVRADAEALMPMMNVERANSASTVVITIDPADATTGVAKFRGFVNGATKTGGARLAYFDDVEITWVQRDDQWRIASYVVFWQGQPINPVDSVRTNRPVRGR